MKIENKIADANGNVINAVIPISKLIELLQSDKFDPNSLIVVNTKTGNLSVVDQDFEYLGYIEIGSELAITNEENEITIPISSLKRIKK
jgi:hypothetical protein